MYCMVCGNKIDQPPDKVTFCPFCGADISKKRQSIMNGSGPVNPESPFTTSPNTANNATTRGPSTPPPQFGSTSFQSPNTGYTPNTSFTPNTPPLWGNQYGTTPSSYSGSYGAPLQFGPFASFGERLIAWIIDMIILYLIGSFITPFFLEDMGNDMLLMLENLNPETMTDAQYEAFMSAATTFLMMSELVGWILSVIYFFLFTWLAKGRTLGKMALKLVVVDQDTLQPVENPGRILIDSLTKRPILLFFDLIIGAIAGSSQRKQFRVTQKLSKTVVVKKNLLPAAPMMNQNPTF